MSAKKYVLVYQAGIANVFQVDAFNVSARGRCAMRMYQGDFRTAEAIMRGTAMAGADTRAVACNKAGNVADSDWSDNYWDAPFSKDFKFHGYLLNAGNQS